MIDIVLIVVVLLLIFGAGKVRSAGSDLGAAVKGFRKELKGPPRPATAAQASAPEAGGASANLPDAEFPEVTARTRGSGKPGA